MTLAASGVVMLRIRTLRGAVGIVARCAKQFAVTLDETRGTPEPIRGVYYFEFVIAALARGVVEE